MSTIPLTLLVLPSLICLFLTVATLSRYIQSLFCLNNSSLMQITASTINGSGPAISDVVIIPQGSNITVHVIVCSVFPCSVKTCSTLLLETCPSFFSFCYVFLLYFTSYCILNMYSRKFTFATANLFVE